MRQLPTGFLLFYAEVLSPRATTLGCEMRSALIRASPFPTEGPRFLLLTGPFLLSGWAGHACPSLTFGPAKGSPGVRFAGAQRSFPGVGLGDSSGPPYIKPREGKSVPDGLRPPGLARLAISDRPLPVPRSGRPRLSPQNFRQCKTTFATISTRSRPLGLCLD
jgi:hypothetical protein